VLGLKSKMANWELWATSCSSCSCSCSCSCSYLDLDLEARNYLANGEKEKQSREQAVIKCALVDVASKVRFELGATWRLHLATCDMTHGTERAIALFRMSWRAMADGGWHVAGICCESLSRQSEVRRWPRRLPAHLAHFAR
jgi:hypothetical protein